jgi:hypothetical protein
MMRIHLIILIQLIKLRLLQVTIHINLKIFCLLVNQYYPKTQQSKISTLRILYKQMNNRMLLNYCQYKVHLSKKENKNDHKKEINKLFTNQLRNQLFYTQVKY